MKKGGKAPGDTLLRQTNVFEHLEQDFDVEFTVHYEGQRIWTTLHLCFSRIDQWFSPLQYRNELKKDGFFRL